jgi:uncharacterized protein with PQ loop repeat
LLEVSKRESQKYGVAVLLTGVLAALVFLIAGVFAFIVSAKGRQSRPLVICFMITMICFFIVALVQVMRTIEKCDSFRLTRYS